MLRVMYSQGNLGNRIVCAGALALLLLPLPLIAGCGGGGGGGSTGGSTTVTRTPVRLTVQWPGRSRSVSAPNSALSGQVVIAGAGNGGNFVWTFNRDPNNPNPHGSTEVSPDSARTGTFGMTLTFFSEPNGGGVKVGEASKQVQIGGNGDLGTFSLSNAVQSVQIVPNQTVPVGQQAGLAFVARDAQGNQVPVTPGSAAIQVVSGQDKVAVNGGSLQGIQPGLAQVAVTVDGVASAAETVAVGNVQLSVNAVGMRSSAPVAVRAGGQTVHQMVDATQAHTFPLDWFAAGQITVPGGYGDRQFVEWRLNGGAISSNPTLDVAAVNFGGGGTLTAVYAQRAPSGGGFSPNFTQSSFPRWQQFPLRVYFVPNGLSSPERTALVQQGMDRWVRATGGFISYSIVNDPNQADVTITYGAMPTPDTFGFCQSTWDQDLVLVKADITLSEGLAAQGGNALATIACHEFGHALGMTGTAPGAGHSADSNDTMFPIGNQAIAVITERDMNTLTNIYLPELTRGRSAAAAVTRSAGTKRVLHTATSHCNH